MAKSTIKVSVVIPSWNAKDELRACLDSLLAQSQPCRIIVVENGSTDGSAEFVAQHYPQIDLIIHHKNKGFAGGVNAGIRRAMEQGDDYVALFNNDAVADTEWLRHLVEVLDVEKEYGIATCKFTSMDKSHLDSTGDLYTVWGLPYPRGRGEAVTDAYDNKIDVFGASGGASLYRVKMLQEIGLFDEDFFAYYEDVDISFRAQLSAWQVRYVPEAIAYHQIGATSSKIKGFTVTQTMKNLPWVLVKNVPLRFLPVVLPRFTLAYLSFLASAIARGQGGYALKGLGLSLVKLPTKLVERRRIQKSRMVSLEYIGAIMTHDLPPNAHKLRRLRATWRRASLRKEAA